MVPSLDSVIARLRLKHFRLLDAIAQKKSLLKAADEVSMTQPGASKSLKEIEDAFGEELFLRTNQGLVANEAGHCAIRYARLILNDLNNLRLEISDISHGYGGYVSVGMTMGSVPIMCQGLKFFQEEFPDTNLQILEGTSFQLLKWLDEGRIELAIGRTNVSSHPEQYVAEPLDHEEVVVITNKQHPLVSHAGVHLADLVSGRWVLFAPDTPLRKFVISAFAKEGLSPPQNTIETTSILVILEMLKSNISCCSVVPKLNADVLLQSGHCAKLDVAIDANDDRNYLVSLANRPLSYKAQVINNMILDLYRE